MSQGDENDGETHELHFEWKMLVGKKFVLNEELILQEMLEKLWFVISLLKETEKTSNVFIKRKISTSAKKVKQVKENHK